MKKYKMIKRPQSNEGVKIEYAISNGLILKSELLRYVEEEFQIEKTIYFDLSSLNADSHYLGEYPVSSVITTEAEINIDVINTVGNEWTEEEANPEWFDVTLEDFEIPEDAEIIQLEELVIPEPEPNAVDALEVKNRELENKVEALKRQLEFSDSSNQVMMFEIFEYISAL